MFIKVNARINIPTKASKNVNMQTLITCAYLEEDIFEGVEYKKFKIEEGKRVE